MEKKTIVARCEDGGIHATYNPNHEKGDARHERIEDGPPVTMLIMHELPQYHLVFTRERLAFGSGDAFNETYRGLARNFSPP